MTNLTQWLATCMAALACFLALIPLLSWISEVRCENVAYAGESIDEAVVSIKTLQPAVTGERAERLGRIITTHAHRRDFDPKLIVALAMRESSFREDVERGDHRGNRGEVGLLQTAPTMAQRFAPNNCDFYTDAECQVATGTRYLAFVRDHCGGSLWVTVAAYGRRSCPTEEEARADVATQRAHAYYQQIGGEQWE